MEIIREEYHEPQIEVLPFGFEDVITTSNLLEPDM